MDILLFLNNKIVNFFFGTNNSQHIVNLVKKHSENLSETGDFSFPLDLRIWCQQLGSSSPKDLSKSSVLSLKTNESITPEDVLQSLIISSSEWIIPLKRARIDIERCVLYLDRQKAMQFFLRAALSSKEYGKQDKRSDKTLYLETAEASDENSLSLYRVQLVSSVIRKLAEYSEYTMKSSPGEECITVLVKSAHGANRRGDLVGTTKPPATIICGSVIDKENNKAATMTTKEYIDLRSTDMQLMAMHKYGIRSQNEKHFRDLIDQLGKAAAIVDLLEAKHSSPVSMKRNGQGSSKGASFILYNSARIETLLRTFDERVQGGVYPELPHFDNINISLLNEEEEWKLVFNYIIGFPNLLKRSLEGLESGRCAPHILPQFLSGLVGVFSIYYRRVRILTDNREHLIPAIHARIYLIKCIREILNRVLAILNIKPVQYM